MGWFRPRRTVRDPRGQEWELYVSRIAPPRWREGGGGDGLGLPPATRFGAPLIVVALPFAFAGFLWGGVVVPGCRFLVALPVAVVTGLRSNAVRIEAISFFPQRETRLWTTTPDQVVSVLAQIAAGIEDGRFVQPDGAVYSGTWQG